MEASEAVTTSTPKISRSAKTTVIVFFIFMLLHQTDKLLIGPLANDIMTTFHMDPKLDVDKWGLINTVTLIVGTALYPLWGWLSDRYNRAKLLAAASFIWGSTTWLSAFAPRFHSPARFSDFLVTRASTGIDDSSYPGIYSLISDLFTPKVRGKVYGILQLTQPIGYLIGMVIATLLTVTLGGWENIFIITGSLGIILAFVIFFTVKDVPRGSGEEELQGTEGIGYKFSWSALKQIFQRKSLWMVYAQGFAGVFPWQVITYYIFLYLENERGYDGTTTLLIMGPAIILMAVGYPVGGWLGDKIFKKNKGGRLIASEIGIVLGMVGLFFAMRVPNEQTLLFAILMGFAAFFMPFASPNIISTMYDVTLPEIRSSAQSIESLIETAGSCSAPLIAGLIAKATSVGTAITWICTIAWGLCVIFMIFAIIFVPADIKKLHVQLEERAKADSAAAAAK